jgi:hypothetical protein
MYRFVCSILTSRKVPYNDVFYHKRKLRKGGERERVADPLFVLRRFLFGGDKTHEAKRDAADRSRADQDQHRFGYVVNVLQFFSASNIRSLEYTFFSRRPEIPLRSKTGTAL